MVAYLTRRAFRPSASDLPDKQNENRACVLCANCPSCQSAACARRCRKTQINSTLRRPAFTKGALRDRHERRKRDAMDAAARATSAAEADGEVVWSWRPWAGVKFANDDLQMTVTKKSWTPRRARSSVNTIAQGVPDRFGEPVVTYSCATLHRTRGCGCVGHPAFPAPSLIEGRDSCKTRAHSRRGTGALFQM